MGVRLPTDTDLAHAQSYMEITGDVRDRENICNRLILAYRKSTDPEAKRHLLIALVYAKRMAAALQRYKDESSTEQDSP